MQLLDELEKLHAEGQNLADDSSDAGDAVDEEAEAGKCKNMSNLSDFDRANMQWKSRTAADKHGAAAAASAAEDSAADVGDTWDNREHKSASTGSSTASGLDPHLQNMAEIVDALHKQVEEHNEKRGRDIAGIKAKAEVQAETDATEPREAEKAGRKQ